MSKKITSRLPPFGHLEDTLLSTPRLPCEDLQTKSKTALKNILQKCVYLTVLEPLLHDAPANILKHVVVQYSKVKFE